MTAPETFRTERLTAGRLSPDDLDSLRTLHGDPKVMATLAADGDVAPEGHTRRSVHTGLEHWDRHGYGTWIFHKQPAGPFVGYCGLWNCNVGGNDEVELAYAVASEHWGRGHATEMAEAVLAVGFGALNLDEVVSFTLPTNAASRRVMQKASFTYERDVVHAGLPHVLYRLSASGRKKSGPGAPAAARMARQQDKHPSGG